ncbi:FAD-dependent monooxygenase [Streptomyces sp. Inha503]|uniref:FAD-dependent monooxygenase n=1 Tax=Streptomyces sp. Inha503 TaxID=3383314 RepID=UPI0039A11373
MTDPYGEIDADVLVVGAGPTGLMLAFEPTLAGARAIVVEKAEHPNPPVPGRQHPTAHRGSAGHAGSAR